MSSPLSFQSQLKSINIADLWNVVSIQVSPPLFQKLLQKRLPSFQKQFLSYIEKSAKRFDQRVSMDFDIHRNFHDTDQLSQPTRPLDFSPSKNFSKSSIDTLPSQSYFHRESNHVSIIDASVCPDCHSSDFNEPTTCSQFRLFQQFRQSDHSDNLRLDSNTDTADQVKKAKLTTSSATEVKGIGKGE